MSSGYSDVRLEKSLLKRGLQLGLQFKPNNEKLCFTISSFKNMFNTMEPKELR